MKRPRNPAAALPWRAAVLALLWSAAPSQAQDAIELRTMDGGGTEQSRLSINSGASAEVRLFTTFNAQGNTITGVSTLTLSGPLTSTIPPGTAPFVISSTTLVANLNADMVDGLHAANFMPAGTDNWVNTAGDVMTGSLFLQNQEALRLNELAVNGMNSLAHRASASMPADVTLTWPAAAGTGGQVLTTDGTGILSWSTVSSGVPAGVILMWSGTLASIPSGWALCDGANGTPDLRDRFILGAAAGEQPGGTGGAHTYSLSEAQLPSHSHAGTTSTGGEHSHPALIMSSSMILAEYPYYSVVTNNASPNGVGFAAGSHDHSFTTSATGSGASIDNRPRYFKLAFIMKL